MYISTIQSKTLYKPLVKLDQVTSPLQATAAKKPFPSERCWDNVLIWQQPIYKSAIWTRTTLLMPLYLMREPQPPSTCSKQDAMPDRPAPAPLKDGVLTSDCFSNQTLSLWGDSINCSVSKQLNKLLGR